MLGLKPHLITILLVPLVLFSGCDLPAGTIASPAPPPPASAYIMKLIASPVDDQLIYAATNGGGLYRTQNGGDHWTDISPGPELRHYNIVVLDPLDPTRMYTGGRENGLWVSSDGGNSWGCLAFTGESILSLVADPNSPERLFVLTPDGVHRNTSGGVGPWEHVFDYPNFVTANKIPWPDPSWPKQFSRFQHLTLDPREPDTLFLGGRWEGGYHRSDDGGETWKHEWIGPIFRRGDRIVPDPVTPHILYAETHHQGMFKSYNNGLSWVSSSHGIAPQKRTAHYGAVLISGSAFDPTDPATIYAGSDYSNWKSVDAGASWTELDVSLTCEFARTFLVAGNTVYAGTNVGLYRSFDGGATWEPCNNGLPTRTILATARGTVNGEPFEWAICAGRPAVYRRSLDSNSDWVSVSWLLYENATAVRFEADTATVVVDTPNGERRSTDGGLRWDAAPTEYVAAPIAALTHPNSKTQPDGSAGVRLSVAIHGAPRPSDAQVHSMYQRPPYVFLAISNPTYPEDGSVPDWTGHWENKLSGIITIPSDLINSAVKKNLRVEVRDFQYGTRTGSASIDTTGAITVKVSL